MAGRKTQMVWTKEHSKRAVAAKARLRIARARTEPSLAPTGKVPLPRRPKPDFIIRIESKRGERVQLSLTRWEGWFITADGIKSARQIARGIELLIRLSA